MEEQFVIDTSDTMAWSIKLYEHPNDMIAHLYDPVESRRYDSAMLVLSFLIDQLNKFSYDQNDNVLCVYGDPTYPLRRHLQVSLAKKN